MPANLTPQYHQAEQAFKAAKTIEEKIAALEEMLAVIPKHKGTEKLQAELKRRLSKLRKEGGQKSKVARYDPYRIPREGAGQVVLVGFPNTGKSSIVRALTRAKVTIAEYPYSTTIPVAGMMLFEDIAIQLVDTPPISESGIEGGLVNLLQQTDLLVLTVDAAADNCLEQLETSINLLDQKKVGFQRKSGFLLFTKVDQEQALENIQLLEEFIPDNVETLTISVQDSEMIEKFRQKIFAKLEIIRVYSKVPGQQPDLNTPFVLKKGSTVLDFAEAIHRDFPKRLKSARVWGSVKFPGQAVDRNYVLADGDIVELHV